MQKRTTGTVISAKKQWWFKVNTKSFRKGPLDGATFPYIVKVKYTAEGREYVKTKWIGPEYPAPAEGQVLQLVYDDERPDKIKVVYYDGLK